MKTIYNIFIISMALLSINTSNFDGPNIPSSFKQDKGIEYKINTRDDNYDIPEISMEVRNMPWKNDTDFLKAKEKSNTPILLSGFCAVLKNPLPGEDYNVNLASKNIKGFVIKPGKTFSQNLSIGPYTKLRGYKPGASYIGGNIIMTEGGGVCKIATTLYNLAVFSNLQILERHNHSMPVNYVPYGQDATVAYGVKDIRFKNTTDNSILIWSEMIGNRLYMGFYGKERPPQITWHHEIYNIVNPSVKYIKNPNLPKGEMIVILEGLDGGSVKSSITITNKDKSYIIKNMGTSYYFPLPRIIEVN